MASEIKEMGAVTVCQFPGCLVRGNARKLNSDHLHDGYKINPENYRGEICMGHNILMAAIDSHVEYASAEILEYANRRPYTRNKDRQS